MKKVPICPRCKKNERRIFTTGNLGSYCRDCKIEIDRLRYPMEAERRSEIKKKRIKDRRTWLYNFLMENPCEICGESDIRVLEFDHIDPSSKSGTVSDIAHSSSLENLKKEVKKCRVLCANCHRKITAEELNWWILEFHNFQMEVEET